jgi:hypothetical protein
MAGTAQHTVNVSVSSLCTFNACCVSHLVRAHVRGRQTPAPRQHAGRNRGKRTASPDADACVARDASLVPCARRDNGSYSSDGDTTTAQAQPTPPRARPATARSALAAARSEARHRLTVATGVACSVGSDATAHRREPPSKPVDAVAPCACAPRTLVALASCDGHDKDLKIYSDSTSWSALTGCT